jgi:hypothetical protein
MKTGSTLPELATELQRQLSTKRDYLAPTTALAYHPANGDPEGLELAGVGRFGVTPHTHGQLSDYLGIPAKYYQRLRQDHPALLAANINGLLAAKPERRLVRTLDGQARAFLSGKYRPLDHVDLAEAVLPALFEQPELRVESCALTEQRLYIKAVTPRIQAEVKRGDVVQAGVVISNSEVGAGSVKIEPLVYRLVCLNGAIVNDARLQKYHVGKGLGGEGDVAAELYRDDTRKLDDAAFWHKVRDVVAGVLTERTFGAIVARWTEATERRLVGDPVQVVEVTAQRFGLDEQARGGILNALISAGDLSQYGLAQAVTNYSQRVDSYDRATDLERLGGHLLDLSPTEWKVLADPK